MEGIQKIVARLVSPVRAVIYFNLLSYCCWHIMLYHHICVLALEVYVEGVCVCGKP
jgi:hypothetical protein